MHVNTKPYAGCKLRKTPDISSCPPVPRSLLPTSPHALGARSGSHRLGQVDHVGQATPLQPKLLLPVSVVTDARSKVVQPLPLHHVWQHQLVRLREKELSGWLEGEGNQCAVTVSEDAVVGRGG